MLFSYFKIALRNIRRQKIYSAINIIGLATGLTISLVIAFYVYDDITFDRFHEHAGSVYRVVMQSNVGQGGRTSAITAGPLLPAAEREIPEVITGIRLIRFGQIPIDRMDSEAVDEEERDPIRGSALVVDPDFLDVFSFRILSGDPSDLENPNAVFLTPEMASIVFGEEEPMGKALQIPGMQDSYVAGLIEEPPGNSHLQFDMVIRLRVEQNPVWWDSWENQVLSGYVRLDNTADASVVESKMDQLAHANGFPENYTIKLQPLLDVHLHSADYAYDVRNFGKKDVSVVYVMTVIGIMILCVASINFINLSSARAAKRAREVGMRKVVGSERLHLIIQFLGESVFITCIAMVIAVFILQLALPHLEGFLQKDLKVDLFGEPLLFLIFFGTAVGVGLLSGVYPALILSGFQPIMVLRGEFETGKKGVLMRRILVVFQFAITVALILGVLTVMIQIRYLKTVNLGYNREQVLAIPNFLRNDDDLLKARLTQIPSVKAVGRSNRLMGEGLSVMAIPEGFDRSNSLNWWCLYIDDGFFQTLDISMAQGREFSDTFPTDREDGVIINEAALELAGWNDAIGKRIDLIMEEGDVVTVRVIGVVKDFHFTSTRRRTGPMFFLYNHRRSPLILARLTGGQILQAREQIEQVHQELYPDRDFNAFFLDDIFDRQFNDDREFASHLAFFAGVAIFIACLGLVGLVSFAVEQRRKEIAVRKVLGCSEGRLVTILALDFLKWILVANVVAWPLGYFAMQRWLQEFIYRVPFTVWPFLFSGMGALVLAMLTISFQSIRASRMNPALALRQEV